MQNPTFIYMQILISFLSKAIKGDIQLWKMYWIYGVLGVGALYGIDLMLTFNHFNTGLFYTLLTSLGYVYIFFIIVSTFRSAVKYNGNKAWKVLVIIICIASVGKFCQAFIEGYSGGVQSVSEELKELNRDLPKLIDDNTRLDYVTEMDKDIHFNLTLVKYLISDLDLTELQIMLTTRIRTIACNDTSLKPLLNKGKKMVYQYYDKTGRPAIIITISKSDCF